MLRVKGIYRNGKIDLESNPPIHAPANVIVSFPEVKATIAVETRPEVLQWSDFSFDKSRSLLKVLKSSLSEEVITERRNS